MKGRSSVSPLRVLVVDDSQDMCASTALLLGLWGYEACVANDGSAALEAVAAFKPDVVLLDIAMPGMDGFQVAQRIRQGTAETCPLLVTMSGFGAAEYRLRALEAGCDLHLLKPVDPEISQHLLASHATAHAERAFVADWASENCASL
jgi:two-component system, chemotaxis family, CheB/CheR fusion protein